jgi:hypothetical protein
MRAVSLSDPGVKGTLAEQFVCTWTDISADPACGSSHPHDCTDQARELARGLGEHNTQTLILTPDGRLLGALAGYVGPADLLEELRFATSLWAEVQKAPSESRRKEVVQAAHAAFARDLGQRKARGGQVGWEEEFFGRLKDVGHKRGVADHEFSSSHALMPADELTTAMMVGDEKSAFVAQTNSNNGSAAPLPAIPGLFDQMMPKGPRRPQGKR